MFPPSKGSTTTDKLWVPGWKATKPAWCTRVPAQASIEFRISSQAATLQKAQALGWSSRNTYLTKHLGASCICGRQAGLACGWAWQGQASSSILRRVRQYREASPRSTLLSTLYPLRPLSTPGAIVPNATYHQWNTGTKTPSQQRYKIPTTNQDMSTPKFTLN